MYKSEAVSDSFMKLVDLFGIDPDPTLLKAVVYDRACDIYPFIKRLSDQGNSAAQNYLNLDIFLDSFHAQSHTEDKCNINHPDCMFHPDLSQFSKYKGMDSQIAEQSFQILNRFKCTTRKISPSTRLLFLKFIDHTRNIMIESSQNRMDLG